MVNNMLFIMSEAEGFRLACSMRLRVICRRQAGFPKRKREIERELYEQKITVIGNAICSFGIDIW